MGVVFRATQLGLGRTVALKVVAQELAEDPLRASAYAASRESQRRSTTPT